ncbi:MAG: hypothetical protein CME26_14590 [Gemmatimonadetes bacterium]|nr:hypothetical protein [Gemmatimonadota bacterium]
MDLQFVLECVAEVHKLTPVIIESLHDNIQIWTQMARVLFSFVYLCLTCRFKLAYIGEEDDRQRADIKIVSSCKYTS